MFGIRKLAFGIFYLGFLSAISEAKGNSVTPQIDTVSYFSYEQKFHKFKFINVDSSFKYLHKIDRITSKFPKSGFRVKYYGLLGGLLRIKRDIPGAIAAFEETVKLAREISDEEAEMKGRLNLATAYGDSGNDAMALSELKDLEFLISARKNHYGLTPHMYANMISFYLSLEDKDKAYEYSDLLGTMTSKYEDSVMYQISRLNLLIQDEKYYEAVELGSKSLKTIRSSDLYYLYQVYGYLGLAYHKLKNNSQAMLYLNEARSLSSKLGVDNVNVDICFGEMALDKAKYAEAAGHFTTALQLGTKHGNANVRAIALKGLTRAYRGMHDFDKGFAYQEQYLLLKDSLIGIEKKKVLLGLEARYSLKEKEEAMGKQLSINKLQADLLEIERQKRNLTLFFFFVSIIVSLSFYRGYRKRVKYSRELVREQERVEEYSHQLEQANKMKDKLFAVISHDLRGSVNSLVSLVDHHKDKEEVYGQFSPPLYNVQLILNNLLKWSRLQLKDQLPVMQEVDLKVLITGVVNQLDTAAMLKHIVIATHYNHKSCVLADEDYLQIILRNLLSNAVKFTFSGGYIRISTREDNGFVEVLVRDSGAGMRTEELESIFHYPKSQKGTEGEKGTGIGLTLSKELVDKMNGTLKIRSKEGDGTLVELRIPLINSDVECEVTA